MLPSGIALPRDALHHAERRRPAAPAWSAPGGWSADPASPPARASAWHGLGVEILGDREVQPGADAGPRGGRAGRSRRRALARWRFERRDCRGDVPAVAADRRRWAAAARRARRGGLASGGACGCRPWRAAAWAVASSSSDVATRSRVARSRVVLQVGDEQIDRGDVQCQQQCDERRLGTGRRGAAGRFTDHRWAAHGIHAGRGRLDRPGSPARQERGVSDGLEAFVAVGFTDAQHPPLLSDTNGYGMGYRTDVKKAPRERGAFSNGRSVGSATASRRSRISAA